MHSAHVLLVSLFLILLAVGRTQRWSFSYQLLLLMPWFLAQTDFCSLQQRSWILTNKRPSCLTHRLASLTCWHENSLSHWSASLTLFFWPRFNLRPFVLQLPCLQRSVHVYFSICLPDFARCSPGFVTAPNSMPTPFSVRHHPWAFLLIAGFVFQIYEYGSSQSACQPVFPTL